MNLQELAQVNLLKELGIDQLPKQRQEEVLIQMSEIIEQRIILRLLEELPHAEKQMLSGMIQEDDQHNEEIELFLKEKVPQLDKIALEEIGRYKGEMLELINSLMKES